MPFLSFSYLIALAGTSNTMLNKSSKREHSYPVHDLRGNVLSFTTEYDVSYGIFIYGFLLYRGSFVLLLVR